MRRGGFILLPLLLAGCASIKAVIAPDYVPVPIQVFNEPVYVADVKLCLVFTQNKFSPSMNVGTLATQTFGGATQNTSLIPVQPLTPLYGAAGALAGSLADNLYGLGGSRYTVNKNCVEDFTRRDGSAIVARPAN